MLLEKMKNLVVEEEGQALTEYGLIIGLVAIGCIALLATIGDEIASYFQAIVDAITGADDPTPAAG